VKDPKRLLHKLLIGAAGYWLANRDDDFKMQYFGGLARWTLGGDRRLGVSWLRLDAGVGYRAIGGADLLHEQLRGVSGTIAVRFGGH
jgi:hypothetical protein